MSWGRGIALALICFIGFILTLVVIIMRQNVDLVTDDYYLDELAFEDEMEARVNGNQTERYQSSMKDDFLIFEFPQALKTDSILIKLIRPNDERMDQVYRIKTNQPFLIPQEVLVKGNYQVECSYFSDGKRLSQYGELKVD